MSKKTRSFQALFFSEMSKLRQAFMKRDPNATPEQAEERAFNLASEAFIRFYGAALHSDNVVGLARRTHTHTRLLVIDPTGTPDDETNCVVARFTIEFSAVHKTADSAELDVFLRDATRKAEDAAREAVGAAPRPETDPEGKPRP